jgi:hypothetical protein
MPFSLLNLAPIVYTRGQAALGGIVAYILVHGDPGYDANVQHGLIISSADLSSGIRWWNGSYITTGATGIAVGTGLANTNAIIAAQGAVTTSYAAGLARAHNGGGYNDWYLPSRNETTRICSGAGKVVTSGVYWASTEGDQFGAGIFDYTVCAGNPNWDKADTLGRVRAVRSF